MSNCYVPKYGVRKVNDHSERQLFNTEVIINGVVINMRNFKDEKSFREEVRRLHGQHTRVAQKHSVSAAN